VLRGKDSEVADVSAFRDPSLYSSQPFNVTGSGVPCELWSHDLGREKSATLVSNGQCSVIGGLDRTIDRAWRMFASRAFVHQYVTHGLQEEDFIDCFATLEQILADYKRL
jgi:tubulin delta